MHVHFFCWIHFNLCSPALASRVVGGWDRLSFCDRDLPKDTLYPTLRSQGENSKPPKTLRSRNHVWIKGPYISWHAVAIFFQMTLQCVCNKCFWCEARKVVINALRCAWTCPISTIKQRDKKNQTECHQILSIVKLILELFCCFVSARTHVKR